MNTLYLTTSSFWIVAAGAVVWYFAMFRRYVERQTTVDAPSGFADDAWPEALVIMSLRGGDDSLRDTLDGLAAQNYPNYRLRLVIDNRDDEVNRVVRSWRRSHPGVAIQVEYLREPLRQCTLKCSAVHQVLTDEAKHDRAAGQDAADRRDGVVVLIDGDSDPYPNWLRDVVAPLADRDVGGVTGNRWYYPRAGGIAAWCRFVFTAFSLPAMWRSEFSWGGTLALRREIACSPEFLDAFARTPTEEQTCFEVLPTFGKRMHFAPQLIQWNPETIDFAGAEAHLFRQSAWSRLFYPCWVPIIVGVAMLWCALVASLVSAGFAFTDARPEYLLPLALMAMFCATIASALARLHRTLQAHVFTPQGRELPALNVARVAELLPAIFATLAVYTVALSRAHVADQIHWRGIEYRLFTDDTIAMMGYVPWTGATKTPVKAPARTKVRTQTAHTARV
jgi:hypothetical protein